MQVIAHEKGMIPYRQTRVSSGHQPVRAVTLVSPLSVFVIRMVLDTASSTLETTVESQLSATVSGGDF
jgi:hypothetical protein